MFDKAYGVHPSLHDWENWDGCSALYGYETGAKHVTGVRMFHSEKRIDMGKHMQYSGSALRRVEEFNGTDAIDIMEHHVQHSDTFSRLDIALDFINTNVKVSDFENAFMNGDAITRIKSAAKTQSLTGKGYTFYIGSLKSKKKLVRVYDKAAEQHISGDWIRVENQVMGKPATAAATAIVKSSKRSVAMSGVMKNICDFPTISQWTNIMDNIEQLEIGSISSEKGDTRKWLFDQCIPALVRELQIDPLFWNEFENEVNKRYYNETGRPL